MTVLRRVAAGWIAGAPEPAGDPVTLPARLHARAGGGPIAFGIDCPLGLPRAFAIRHGLAGDFPAFLRGLAEDAAFFQPAARLEEISAARPFYPARGEAGMTRLSHAAALGLADAAALCRDCDRATALRPAGAPVFWTLGANQSGKAAIAAWRWLIRPAWSAGVALRLWPFEGDFLPLLAAGGMVMAETYPAEALRQLGLKPAGSKRRQSDRAAYAAALRTAMAAGGISPGPGCAEAVADGFGADAAGEDRFDSFLGALCVASIVDGRRADHVPDDPWIRQWEGWVLGQSAAPLAGGDAA